MKKSYPSFLKTPKTAFIFMAIPGIFMYSCVFDDNQNSIENNSSTTPLSSLSSSLNEVSSSSSIEILISSEEINTSSAEDSVIAVSFENMLSSSSEDSFKMSSYADLIILSPDSLSNLLEKCNEVIVKNDSIKQNMSSVMMSSNQYVISSSAECRYYDLESNNYELVNSRTYQGESGMITFFMGSHHYATGIQPFELIQTLNGSQYLFKGYLSRTNGNSSCTPPSSSISFSSCYELNELDYWMGIDCKELNYKIDRMDSPQGCGLGFKLNDVPNYFF